jgi:hypothetical protein
MESYSAYFTVHAIFFLGAAAFQRHPIPKTLLAGFIINSIFTFLSLFMMLILFGKFEKFDNETVMMASKTDQNFHYFFTELLPQIVRASFIYIIPVIFYIAAFFKLKEREV